MVHKPRVPNPTDRWDYDETVSYEPGGKLALYIHTDTPWGEREERKRWSDAKLQRVESRIADFVAGLMRTAIAQRRREEKRKRDEAEKETRIRPHASAIRTIAAYAPGATGCPSNQAGCVKLARPTDLPSERKITITPT